MTQPDGLEFKTLAVANPAEPDTHGVIEALVAVTGVKDEVNDYIEPGAFRRTLSERPRPKVCLGHDWNRPIGKTLEIAELMPGDQRLPKQTADGRPWPRTAGALWARFQVNLDSDDGKSAFSAAKFYGPEQSTYSIGYRTARARQRGSTRHIQDLDLFEYGPVLNPANRLATLQSIKSDRDLTNPVDSERQDFETGDGAVETKTKYVRDADYWGKPIGTPITPGMKPRGGNDRERGTSDTKPSTNSLFSSLPDDEQAVVRALPTEQRIKYLDARAAGKDHDEAMAATGRTVNEQSEDEKYRRAVAGPAERPELKPADKPSSRDIPIDVQERIDEARRNGRDDQAAKIYADYLKSKKSPKAAAPAKPKKPTAKQKALLFEARPGRIMTYRRDENGQRIYGGPFPNKEGLIFRGHANSAYPMEKAGWAEAGYDGRHYILTPEGERLRAQLEGEDNERQTQLREERRVAALGPKDAEAADANVDADAAPMDMTPRQYADRQAAAQARRNRARNIAAEEAVAAKESDQVSAADKAAALALGAIDIDAYRRRTNNPKAELAGGDRVVLTGAGTKNWSLSTVDGLGIVRSVDFNELAAGGERRRPLGKTQLRDLANRLAGIRDAQGRSAPFDYPNPDPEKTTPEWIRGWRDVTGADLQSAIAGVAAQWGEDNDLTYRRSPKINKPNATIPGGVADPSGFRMRKAEELAPGDQVRLPDGSVGTVERSGADLWHDDSREAKAVEGKVLFDDGRMVDIRELAGLEKPAEPEIGTGPNARSDAYVARKRGGSGGPAARDMVIPIKFAPDADSPEAGHDPGMGSLPATQPPPGRPFDVNQLVSSNYVSSLREKYEPLPEGSRVVQNEREPDSFLPRDSRAKIGTALSLITEINGETYQTVRLDDGTYDQWRVRGVRGELGSEGAFEIDPTPERVDQVRRERGLPPVAESTPLRREPKPEPESPAVQEVSIPAEPVQDLSTPEAAPATPPKLTATETLPEQQGLPYEVIKKPNRSGKGARVRYNGREYNVNATTGVLAEVTVTDDDGHSATVAGGSSTMLRREQFADRERALRQALAEAEAQHNAAPESTSGTEPELSGTETEPSTPTVPRSSPRPAAPGVLTSQDAVLAALDRTAGANLDTRPGYASPSESAAKIAEAVRGGDRKIATSPAAPPGLYMLSPPSHMPKGGYPWELQAAVGARIPLEVIFVPNRDSRLDAERFAPKSGKRSSFLLEAIGETVRDADGNPPPWNNLDTSWSKDWRDTNGLTAPAAMRRFAVPAYLRKIGENERADDYERAQEPLPNQAAPEVTPEVPEAPPAPAPSAPEPELPPSPVRVVATVPEYQRRYGDLSDNELEAARDDARQRAQTDSSAQNDLIMIRKEMDRRESMRADVAKAPDARPTPEPEPTSEPETATIPVEQLDEAATLQDEVLGIVEQPDGTIEVTEEVADRQDRVAALIEQDDAGTLDLGDKSDAELTNTRQDLSDELRLQSVLATRQAAPKPEIVKSPAGAPEKPPQRPGLAGAAEDYSEALQSGDTEAITRTRARLESSLRRSRAGSESARALADHITGEGDDDAEQLTAFAQRMRRETREKRNAAARRRRTARRLERVRIQSLIDKIDAELQTRSRSTQPPTNQSSADQLAANYEQMHGTAGVRKQIDRLRNQNRLSARDQELLAALEARVPKANADRPRAAAPTRVTHQAGDRVTSEFGQGTVVSQTGRSLTYRLDSGETLNVGVGTPGYDRVRPIAELTSRDDSANVASMTENESPWAGKNWRQALRDMPREERTELGDKVGAHRYKVYADERAKGEPHVAALRVASGEDENGPSVFAGKESLERVAAELDGIDPKIGRLRPADLFNELAYRKQRQATGRKPLVFENVDSESYRKRQVDLEIPVVILTALAEQERAHASSKRDADLAFTDNPAKMSPARLRAQMFALERSQNALDQKRLAQLRRAADKRGISPIAGQLAAS